jgi:ParB-like chromosome segregation protein Spo0J
MRVEIDRIKIGHRVRKDFGDLEALAESIRAHGLLQPVVITPEYELIDGERRLRVHRDIFEASEIEARIVDIEHIAFGEHDANVLRENFKPSERVAIAEKVAAAIRERRGRPLNPNAENVPDLAPLEKGRRTRELVAERAGFGAATTYEEAKRVADKGIQELVTMMDSGDVPITVASELARAAPDVQMAAVSKGPATVKSEARRLQRERREKDNKGSKAKKVKVQKKGAGKSGLVHLQSVPELGTDGRPVRLNRFYLSLRSLYDTITEMDKKPAEFLAYAAEHRTIFDPVVWGRVTDFLSDVEALWEADQAA